MEHISEQIAENIPHIAAFKMEFLIASVRTVPGPGAMGSVLSSPAKAGKAVSSGSRSFFKGRMSKLIVKFSLLRIAEEPRMPPKPL